MKIRTYEYNDKNRLVEIKDHTNGILTCIVKYTYNEGGYTQIDTFYHAKETLGSPKDTVISKYSCKEDKYGYITERRTYKENGELKFAYYPKYDSKGNKIEEQCCKANGVLMFTYKYEYDKYGSIIRSMICQRNGQINSDYKTFYKYEFDKKGNWVKMVCYKNEEKKTYVIFKRAYEYYE
ncbi:MAG: hypothetical protein KGV44_01120 [Flavobacteriaceae bacterium]|nr:hypothetical protein [Flavobacteriaceae bacterium]